ncbi:MAG: Ig-like domain-containing protein, partial [Chloroflexota bacterium]
ELDTTITLTAATETGSTFSGWSGSVSSLSNPIVLTLEAAESVTATFTLETNAVAVVNNGTGNGRVASDPAGIDCGSSCTYEFDYNSVVTLTAAADNDSTFTGWSGSCSVTDCICVVTIDAVKAAVAEFTLNQYALTTAAAGTGSGTISRSMDADLYDHGTVVTLTATADDGSTFVGWSGDCSGSDDCPITLDEAQTVTATFDDIAEPVFPNEPLNEPTDGSQLKTTRPTFDWDAASDNQTWVISYTLVLTQTEATRSAENTVFTFETRETSLTVDFDLMAGEYTWAVHSLDEAGNISAQTDTFSFTIDIDESDDDDTADGLHRLYLPVITRP